MNYKSEYVEAFNKVHPAVEVKVTGPNKKGLHSIYLNGDAGDLRLFKEDIIGATQMLLSKAPPALRNAKLDGSFKLETKANLK